MKMPPPPEGVLMLAVDLQPKLISVMSSPESLRSRVKLAISSAHGMGIPVVFTEQIPAKLGETDPEILACAPGSPAFGKATFSVFADDGIREALNPAGIEHLILCGLETPVCIYQTALEALNLNIQVTLLTDAIGARRDRDAEVCLRALGGSGVHLLPTETVFYSLLHDAGHPFFRSFTQLVKTYA